TGITGAGLAPSVKKSTDLDISGAPDWKDVDDALRASLQRGVESYCEVNESLSSVKRLVCTGLRLRRYDLNEFFDWHIDSFDGTPCSIPVSNAEIEAAKAGNWRLRVTGSEPVPGAWLPTVRGLRVLCLGGGGGQQAPILAAAGGLVTVVDLSPAQLSRDRLLA